MEKQLEKLREYLEQEYDLRFEKVVSPFYTYISKIKKLNVEITLGMSRYDESVKGGMQYLSVDVTRKSVDYRGFASSFGNYEEAIKYIDDCLNEFGVSKARNIQLGFNF